MDRKCSPFHLPVHKKKRLFDPACSGCMDCVNVCPSAGTLSLQSPARDGSGWMPERLAVAVVLVFVVMVFVALITGHWQSRIGDGEFKMLLRKRSAIS